MNRRTLLVAGGVGVAAALGGCLDESTVDDGTGADDGENGSDDGEAGDDDGTDDPITEDPRVDEPPYGIDRPEPPDGPGDDGAWPEEYLGENMPTEPSLRVEPLSISRGVLRDHLRDHADPSEDAYRVRLLTSQADIDDIFDTDAPDDDAADRLRSVDFDERVVAVVESGFGSGSVSHRWARAEVDDGVLGLHGYYTDPYVRTGDVTSRLSVLELERSSDGPEYVRVSLTVAEDRRVQFNCTEGVVNLE